MRKLLFLGMALALTACGDDDGREPGTDSGTPGVDSGTPGVDSGTPGTDSGTPGTDSGTPGTDSGMSTGMCPAGTCDYIANGCEAGEACYPNPPSEGEDAVPFCAPSGTVAIGGSCSALNDCVDGALCLATGICAEMCCGGDPSTCSEPGALCQPLGGAPGVGACEVPAGCDVIDQTGCADGLDCVVLAGDGATGCRDLPEGGGTQGADCSDTACAPGFICLTPMGGTPTCARACNPMSPSCPDATTCAGAAMFPPTLGACFPMM